MSRRDTIIIAVLVNAALLMILFATAMHSDKPKGENKKEAKLTELAKAATPAKSSTPEDILNDFVTSVPTVAEIGSESVYTLDETELVFAPTTTPFAEIPTVSQESRVTKPKIDEQVVQVTVKKGDYLEKLAKNNNTTVAAIMKANNMATTQLKVGQVLKIPLTDGKKPSVPTPSNSSAAEYYVVKEGDNPWLIASRNKINLEELLRINGLDDQKAKRLRPGDKLKIR